MNVSAGGLCRHAGPFVSGKGRKPEPREQFDNTT